MGQKMLVLHYALQHHRGALRQESGTEEQPKLPIQVCKCCSPLHLFNHQASLQSTIIQRGHLSRRNHPGMPVGSRPLQNDPNDQFLPTNAHAEHLRGLRTTNDASDKLDGEMETKQTFNKQDADSHFKWGKDRITNKKTRAQKETQDLPTKWKTALDTFIKKPGRSNIPSNLKIKELLKADNHNN